MDLTTRYFVKYDFCCWEMTKNEIEPYLQEMAQFERVIIIEKRDIETRQTLFTWTINPGDPVPEYFVY